MASRFPETRKSNESSLFPSGNSVPFFLVTALFFLWGIPNNLNDVLIRQFMKSFEISRFEAGLIQFAFYLGYLVFALPAGLVMRKQAKARADCENPKVQEREQLMWKFERALPEAEPRKNGC